MKNFLSSLIIANSLFSYTNATANNGVNETIARFHENPSAVMNEVPEKTPVVGDESMLDYMNSPFGHKPLGLGDIVEIKEEGRNVICRINNGVKECGDEKPARSGVRTNDNFMNVIDYNASVVKTLEQIESRNLLSGELSEQPWSDDYWAIANGVLAHRYAHDSGEKNHQWQEAFNKFKGTPTQELIDQGLIHQLSPAEKYDLLVGDKNFTLTSQMFLEGKGYFDRNGEVEPWMGICHGWAAAAYMLPRPKKVVWVKSADGKYDIPFYPSDIKSLGSLIYAKNNYESKFIGGRCNTKDPEQDANGRVLDQNCFDNNPATWHLAIVNQIGLNNRSIVMDATFDYEVWNQPVLSYKISYFNPAEFVYKNNLRDAISNINDFKNDKFKQYRDSRTRFVVGIEMDVKYIVETSPRQTPLDSPSYDGIKSVTYRYDLELDGTGDIIGGEWYTNLHPDFLWSPLKTARVYTQADRFLASRGIYKWSANEIVPSTVGQVVGMESRRGSPLALIVDGLFEAASK